MSAADRARWDERFAATAAIEAAGPAIPDALVGHEGLLPRSGRALDVACGCGASVVWLARHGLTVDAVDVSAVALDAGAALAGRHGVNPRWWVHDLDGGLPDGCAGPYDVVVCQRFRDPALYAALGAAVAPEGLLVLTVLSTVGGREGRFRAAPGELAAAFDGWRVVDHREGAGEAHLLARPGDLVRAR